MTTSMSDAKGSRKQRLGGMLADGFTSVRVLLIPAIVILLLQGWPDNGIALLVSGLIAIAALTDILDDYFGGPQTSVYRQFGWFDDVADTLLVLATLATLFWVIFDAGLMTPYFAIPAAVIILRELCVGLFKGYELSRFGWPETRLGTLKNALYMLSICLLIASPWLTSLYDSTRANPETIIGIYDNPSTLIWLTGQGLLWLAAVVSVVTGFQLLTQPIGGVDDT